MKTKSSIRRIVRTRAIFLSVTLATAVLVEFVVGEALVSRLGRATATAVQTEQAPAPNLSLGDVLASIR